MLVHVQRQPPTHRVAIILCTNDFEISGGSGEGKGRDVAEALGAGPGGAIYEIGSSARRLRAADFTVGHETPTSATDKFGCPTQGGRFWEDSHYVLCHMQVASISAWCFF
jgi:hypothetical protein